MLVKKAATANNNYFSINKRRTTRTAMLFLLPGMVIYLFFIGGPILISGILSLFKFNLIKGSSFVGFKNFVTFINDVRLQTVIVNTLKYAVILIPLHTVVSLMLALLADKQPIRLMKTLTRSSIYFPFMITTASAAAAWAYMFDGNTGVLNYFLVQLGISPVRWLTTGEWPYLALAIYSFWKYLGEPFLYYLIGLQGIPDDYLEAAQIDGANAWQMFFRVKLPLLTPTIFYVLVIKTIHCFQVFEEPFLLTLGGPGDSTRSLALYLYDTAFTKFNMGYASVLSLFLFAVTMIITLILFGSQKKWVCYDT